MIPNDLSNLSRSIIALRAQIIAQVITTEKSLFAIQESIPHIRSTIPRADEEIARQGTEDWTERAEQPKVKHTRNSRSIDESGIYVREGDTWFADSVFLKIH